MKTIVRLLTTGIIVLFAFGINLAQVPGLFNYQAVVRGTDGHILANENVNIRFSIYEENQSSVILFSEYHETTANAFGLINLKVGSGININGAIDDVDWGSGNYFLKVEISQDDGTTYTEIGNTKLVSVPYALYAQNVQNINDADADPNNEYQTLAFENDSLAISNGNKIQIPITDTTWRSQGNNLYYNEGKVGIGTNQPVSNLEIKGTELNNDTDPLLAVVNSTGDTVFSVFQSGVRIYVDDNPDSKVSGNRGGFAVGGFSSSKGLTNEFLRVTPDSVRVYVGEDEAKVSGNRGGFAVGGFSSSKGLTNEFLRVTPDSVRIYIEESATKVTGNRGGFAVGGFSSSKDSPTEKADILKEYFNISGNYSADVVNPSEARILWYPNKEAFMAGRVLVESPDSVGLNSWATGYESKSIGNYSQALGYKAKARGNNSTAIGNLAIVDSANSYAFGNNTYVSDINSYAIGNGASVSGEGAYAIGSGALAQGNYSFALGSDGIDSAGIATNVTKALGDYSYAFGMGSIASSIGAFAMGTQDTASGQFSVAIGYKAKAIGSYNSVAIGSNCIASGNWSSFAFGNGVIASGDNSTALGDHTEATGNFSTTLGWRTRASGEASTAMGLDTKASGQSSTAMGKISEAIGFCSTAMGFEAIASGNISFSAGNYTTAGGEASVALGQWTKANGYVSVAIGHSNSAKGDYSIALGRDLVAKSFCEVVVGSNNDTTYSLTQNEWIETEPIFTVGNAPGGAPGSNAFMVLKNGSVGIGCYPGATGENVLAIKTTMPGHQPPTVPIADGVLLFAQDVSESAELKVMDEAGNTTTLSPHSFILTNKSEPMAWSFFSENKNLGYKINIDMLKAIRTIEELSGEKLVYIQDLKTQKILEGDYSVSFIEVIEQQQNKITELEKRLNAIETLLDQAKK